MDFVIHFVAVAFFQLSHERIVLEQRVTLLVNFELLQTQVRNAVGHVREFIRRRQRLLLLIENTRQQQTALQHRDLFFDIAFRLQRAVQPVFDPDVLLHQRVAIFRRGDQALAELMVDFQLLFHQWVGLDPRGFIRGNGLLRRFFR